MASERRVALSLLIERILSVMTILGLVCLGIGLLLFVAGKTSDVFTVAQVGAIALLVGILLVAVRIFSWLIEAIVERGFEKGLEAEAGS
jgi:uncharacterized membrane protein HdeD (DUF308 family)